MNILLAFYWSAITTTYWNCLRPSLMRTSRNDFFQSHPSSCTNLELGWLINVVSQLSSRHHQQGPTESIPSQLKLVPELINVAIRRPIPIGRRHVELERYSFDSDVRFLWRTIDLGDRRGQVEVEIQSTEVTGFFPNNYSEISRHSVVVQNKSIISNGSYVTLTSWASLVSTARKSEDRISVCLAGWTTISQPTRTSVDIMTTATTTGESDDWVGVPVIVVDCRRWL